MQRTLNRAVLTQLMARQAVALESEEVPVVVPTEAAADTTAEAVAAAAGEAGVPEAAPVAETTAPTVIIKVEVQQASKPAEGTEAPAVEIAPAAEPVADVIPEAAAEIPSADAGAAPEVAADAVAAADAPVEGAAEVPAADAPVESAEAPVEGVEADPAATDEVPAADAPAEAAPAEAGEVAPEAPAAGDAAAAEPVAEVPAEGGEAPVEAAPADAGEPAVEPAVDATPSVAETDSAAEEVQAAIDETKAAGEEGAEAAVAREDLVVTGDLTPIGSEPDVITADQIAPELDEMAAELNTYQDSGDALNKIGDILESSAEEGGLNKAAAQVLEVAVEHIHQVLGFKPPVCILAMESFDHPGIRVSATTIAMEEIAKTAKEVWETIKAGIAKFMAMVIGFYDKLVSGALIQGQSAAAILEQVKTMGDVKVAGTVQSAVLVKALARGTTVSKNVPQDLLAVNGVLDKAWEHGIAMADGITGLLGGADNVAAAKEKLVQLVNANVAAVLKPDANLSDVGVADAPEGTQGYATLPLLGNNVLWAYAPKSVEALGKMAFGRQVVSVEVQGDALPILNTGEVKALATIVLNTTKSMAALGGMSRKLKSALNSFNAFAGQAANADSKPDPVLSKVMHQLASGLAANASKIAYANNSAALQYCKASLAKLAPKEEAAPAAAAPAAA